VHLTQHTSKSVVQRLTQQDREFAKLYALGKLQDISVPSPKFGITEQPSRYKSKSRDLSGHLEEVLEEKDNAYIRDHVNEQVLAGIKVDDFKGAGEFVFDSLASTCLLACACSLHIRHTNRFRCDALHSRGN
jgi:hypothetical protein